MKAFATDHHIPVWQPERVKKDVETLTQLKQIEADVFVVIAYGQILSKKILDMPKLGCINVHGSILPQYRGAAPIQWSIYNGEKETGITTMLMDKGMDTGDMLLKATTPIQLLDNAQVLAEKLAMIGADLLIETLYKLERQEITPIPQDHAAATYASLIQKQDYNLDWGQKCHPITQSNSRLLSQLYSNLSQPTIENHCYCSPRICLYSRITRASYQDKIHKIPNLSTISGTTWRSS